MDISRGVRRSRGSAGEISDLMARLIAGRARGALPRRRDGRADTGHGVDLNLMFPGGRGSGAALEKLNEGITYHGRSHVQKACKVIPVRRAAESATADLQSPSEVTGDRVPSTGRWRRMVERQVKSPPPSIKAFEIRYTKINRITRIGRGGSGNPGRLEGFVRPVFQRAWFPGFLWELEKLARVDIKKTKEIHDPNIPILPHIPVYLHLCLFVWKF